MSYTFTEQNEVSDITFRHGKDSTIRPQKTYEKTGLISKGIHVSKVSTVTCPKDFLLHLDC